MKFGRNTSCPCGSGIKYKKCCISKVQALTDREKNKFAEKETYDSNFFTKFDNKQLLATISLLKILPQNHGKNIRLEMVQKLVLQSNNKSRESIDSRELEKYLSKNFSFNSLEDPPENLFTENIMTPLGNMIVFSGVAEDHVYILQSLINVLSDSKDLSDDYIKEALGGSLLMLKMSDLICSSLHYDRNQSLIPTDSSKIYVPDDIFINSNRDKLIFDKRTIASLCLTLKIDSDIIKNFLVDLTLDNFSSNDLNENPLILKPIMRSANDYVVISPTNIVYAVVFNIYKLAIKHNCLNLLVIKYSEECWKHCNYILDSFGYKRINFKINNNKLPIYEGIYFFDTGKLAYVNFQFDSGEDFNMENPLSAYYGKKGVESEILKHRQNTYIDLINAEKFLNFEVFDLNINLGIGRPHIVYNVKSTEKIFNLEIRMDFLNILYLSNKLSNLTLFNFAKASAEVNLITPYFLDNISMFIENDESYYLSDDSSPDLLVVGVGNALKFRTIAIITRDVHLCIYPGTALPVFLPVEREILPAILPIYRVKHNKQFANKILLEAFDGKIWVESKETTYIIESNKNYFTVEICVAIAYWLNEISLRLRPFINIRRIKSLIIKIDIDYLENIVEEFENIDESIDPFNRIIYDKKQNEIFISLDVYFYKALYRNDNLGEQILIKKILYILAETLDSSNKPVLDLTTQKIDVLIDSAMPLSQKKKILFQISQIDIRNNPKNLIDFKREISKFHLNRQLDTLAKSLRFLESNVEIEILGIEKEKLLKRIVGHFQNLVNEQISKFDFNDVILKLLYINESAIYNRENSKFQMIPKIECYGVHCDIEKIISEDFKKNSHISLSVRALLEYIVSNPPKGTEVFSSEKLDESIALMNNIINWGFLYDEEIFGISDTKLSILKSGRIGNSKNFRDEVIEPYFQVKFRENVVDYSNEFISDAFQYNEGKGKVENTMEKGEYEYAFENEFEVDYYDFINIFFESVTIAFEAKGSVYSKNKNEFISALSGQLSINKGTVEKIILTFALFVNDDSSVDYFNFIDEENFPWRYNRKKSILQKPFIIKKNDIDEVIYFGSRSLYDFYVNVNNLIYSGRYKAEKSKMKSFLSKINKEKGDDFNDEIYNLLKNKLHNSIIVEKEVTIGPKKNDIIGNVNDIGDIDILIIDRRQKKIFCVESKNTNFARTPYEMNREINNFISKSGKGWIQKVEARESFVKSDKTVFKIYCPTTEFNSFKIEFLFITKEAIPFNYIKNIGYRFITTYDLKEIDDTIFN